MKIDPPAASATPLIRTTQGGSATLPTTGAGATDRAAAESVRASAQVRSLPGAPGGGDFDAARVAAIREDIRAGRYQIHPERIADGLLASVRDLLDAKKDERGGAA